MSMSSDRFTDLRFSHSGSSCCSIAGKLSRFLAWVKISLRATAWTLPAKKSKNEVMPAKANCVIVQRVLWTTVAVVQGYTK